MKQRIKKWLGVEQIEADLRKLESRLSAFEEATVTQLGKLGKYKTRSESELIEMKAVIECMIETFEVMQNGKQHALKNEQQAKQLLKRLRNNRTRVCNALEAA